MKPVCSHGNRPLGDTEKPHCGDRDCNRAWWIRYGLPFLTFVAAILVVGVLFPDFTPGNMDSVGYSGW